MRKHNNTIKFSLLYLLLLILPLRSYSHQFSFLFFEFVWCFFFECNGLLYVCVCIKVCISMKVCLFFYSIISVNLILIFYHFLWFFDSFLVEGKLGIVLFFPSIHFVLFVFRKLLYIIFFWNIYGNFSQIFGHIVSCLFFNKE